VPRPGRFTPGNEWRLGQLQGRSGRVRKIWPPSGFDALTILPVACCYHDQLSFSSVILILSSQLRLPFSFFNQNCVNTSNATHVYCTFRHIIPPLLRLSQLYFDTRSNYEAVHSGLGLQTRDIFFTQTVIARFCGFHILFYSLTIKVIHPRCSLYCLQNYANRNNSLLF
jgi:hypothetical protein